MSQQYYYNGTQYTAPTTYSAQTVNNMYTGAVAQPLTSGYSAASTGRTAVGTAYTVSGTQISSAHRSQAPVTYTYPTNATVIAPPVAVVPSQQATIVAPPMPAGKAGASYVIANGPTSNISTNGGAYTVTTSYFQQMPPTGTQLQQHGIAQAAAVAAAQQAAVAAANSVRGRRNMYDMRYPNQLIRKSRTRTSIDSQMFYCDVCKISCAGPQTYKEHLDGQKHKKKATGTKIVVTTVTKSNQRQLRCELCDVTCTGADAYQAHIRGTKHQKTFKLHQRLGKPIPCADPLVVRAVPSGSSGTGAAGAPADTTTSVPSEPSNVPGTTGLGPGVTKICAAPKINYIMGKPLASVGVSAGTDLSQQQPPPPPLAPMQQYQVVDNSAGDADSGAADRTQIAEEHVDINSLQEKNIAPVGSEYIETTKNESGKIIQFFCKLCNCKFNDPHAKEMHLKGRRHRLQYKKKVDPSLVVDGGSSGGGGKTSGSARSWRLQEDKMRQKQHREEFWRRRDMQSRMREMQRLEYSNISSGGAVGGSSLGPSSHGAALLHTPPSGPNQGSYRGTGGQSMRYFDTLDDKHVLNKHSSIYPTDDELKTVQSVVGACEKALRQISEILFEDIPLPVKQESSTEDENKASATDKKDSAGERALSGAMRVGALANALLLRGDLVVSMVLLCSKWPTYSLMKRVIDKLPDKLKELLPNDKLDVSLNDEEKCILVTRKLEPQMECYIRLTSSVVREETSNGVPAVQPEDGLDRKRCLDALASLRHTKWFQAKVSNLQPCLILIRILRDLCQRVPTWNPLTDWALELIVEKVISSDPIKLSPGSSLRRFFECLASGILLPGGPGLKDPCEKELMDASAALSDQDREDLTASAQHALRLIAFRQIHKVLDMDPLVSALGAPSTGRKRRHSDETQDAPGTAAGGSAATGGNQKKDKKDEPSSTGVAASVSQSQEQPPIPTAKQPDQQ